MEFVLYRFGLLVSFDQLNPNRFGSEMIAHSGENPNDCEYRGASDEDTDDIASERR